VCIYWQVVETKSEGKWKSVYGLFAKPSVIAFYVWSALNTFFHTVITHFLFWWVLLSSSSSSYKIFLFCCTWFCSFTRKVFLEKLDGFFAFIFTNISKDFPEFAQIYVYKYYAVRLNDSWRGVSFSIWDS